jgi:hypothetical protein
VQAISIKSTVLEKSDGLKCLGLQLKKKSKTTGVAKSRQQRTQYISRFWYLFGHEWLLQTREDGRAKACSRPEQ